MLSKPFLAKIREISIYFDKLSTRKNCNLFATVAICSSNQPTNTAILRDNIAMLPATEHRI
jgi:hypothetical protein